MPNMGRRYLWLFLVSVLLVIGDVGLGEALAQIPNVQGPPANTLPTNVRQTGSGLPNGPGIILPPSPTRPGKDLCGNPLNTTYSEGVLCPDFEAKSVPYVTYKTPWEKWLNITAAILAVAFAGIYAVFHWAANPVEEWAARNLIVILVIGSAVFILTAGYDDKQAAPLFGLLGTLVGYLFGRAPQEQVAIRRNVSSDGATDSRQPQGRGGGERPGEGTTVVQRIDENKTAITADSRTKMNPSDDNTG